MEKPPQRARDVMNDPRNMLGDRYDPKKWYGLYIKHSDLLKRRMEQGAVVVMDCIKDSDGTDMVLLEFPQE